MTIEKLIPYKVMPEWNTKTLPKSFQKKHNTKIGTWGKIILFSGKLKIFFLDENDTILDMMIFDQESHIPFIEPQIWHRIEAEGNDMRCQLSFYCHPKDYYKKKYQISATHSEVIEVTQYIQSGKALDLGCGNGRNALYLQQLGFDVSACDKNLVSINNLKQIIEKENLTNICTYIHDANHANITNYFDLIVCTVVLMFLDPKKIPSIIKNLKSITKPGGYNLIVCAMNSMDYPMSTYDLPFSFGFQSNELKNYYRDWNIVKYNENVGHLHRLDANGKPIALRFATLITQKNKE